MACRTAARLAAGWRGVWRGVCRNARSFTPCQKTSVARSWFAAPGAELGRKPRPSPDPQEDKAILRYAREHNTGKIVIGRRQHRRWFSRESFADKLARRAPDLGSGGRGAG